MTNHATSPSAKKPWSTPRLTRMQAGRAEGVQIFGSQAAGVKS